MTIFTAGETNLLFYNLDFGCPRNTQYLEPSIVRAKLLACHAFIFQRVLYERTSLDRSTLVSVDPLPDGLGAAADTARKIGLAVAQRNSKLQGVEGDVLGGGIHSHQHKPLFKELQTLVYGA
ncbi:hypothetical protein AWB76_06282 [Caballeronia temeraria]|uniref:Uncharacterized protein n=1 Tax=Caballeronia temeraria TaxID=1777137 RepID=A0A158D0X5_9BURK|nr:hypothetical protein AWB76_06282 [Caballeronia temeraria]